MGRKIVILAAGSRGDVQPCVALGRELVARGHAVRLGAAIRRAAGSPATRHRARLIGESMAAENGVHSAATLLEERLGVRPRA